MSNKALKCQRSATGYDSQPEPHQVARAEKPAANPYPLKGTPPGGSNDQGYNRLRELIATWRDMPAAEMRLRLGEMTAQEIRSVRAVLNAILPNAEVSDGIGRHSLH